MESRACALALTLAGTVLTTSVSAQVTPAPMPHVAPMGPAPTPSHIAQGTQYYEADVGGLRRHLEALQASEPKTYHLFDEKLRRLESGQVAGTVLKVTGVLGGLALIAVPWIQLASESCESERDSSMTECGGDFQSSFFIFSGAGLAVGLTFYGLGSLIQPGRQDLLDYVNEFNRVQPKSPLRWQLGYDPATRVARGGFQYSF